MGMENSKSSYTACSNYVRSQSARPATSTTHLERPLVP